RRNRIEELGSKLANDPARIANALRNTRHGADWLIERWEALGEILQNTGSWDEAQHRLAFDLLGIPLDLRNGSTRVPSRTDAKGRAVVVDRELGRLRKSREESLDELDDAERGMTLAGMPMDEDAASARLRRYEASCRRAWNWAHKELQRLREEVKPDE